MSTRPSLGALAEFLRTEAGGASVLLIATVAAIVWANAAPGSYADFWHGSITLGFGGLAVTHDVQEWVNQGLMTVFFFVVGLEIKRELVEGELRDPRVAALPIIAALGGMLVPALIYLAWNGGTDAGRGWGVPMATDIAFALGALALLGSRVAPALKLLLLSIAIVDDIGAIIVIAVFYSRGLELVWLTGAGVAIMAIIAMRGVVLSSPLWYLVPGLLLWYCMLRSGVHATIAGVVLGLLTPLNDARGGTPLTDLEHVLHSWSSYLVIPLFALANAGVLITWNALRGAASSDVWWGIALGLVVGKAVGITAAATLAVRFGIATLPSGVSAHSLIGLAMLGGIGFTVALFVSDLAFAGPVLHDAKLAILVASAVSGMLGAFVLTRGHKPEPAR